MQLQSHTDRTERSSLCHFKLMPCHGDITVDSPDQIPCISHLNYYRSHRNCLPAFPLAPLSPSLQKEARVVFIKCKYHNPDRNLPMPSHQTQDKCQVLVQPIQFCITGILATSLISCQSTSLPPKQTDLLAICGTWQRCPHLRAFAFVVVLLGKLFPQIIHCFFLSFRSFFKSNFFIHMFLIQLLKTPLSLSILSGCLNFLTHTQQFLICFLSSSQEYKPHEGQGLFFFSTAASLVLRTQQVLNKYLVTE